MFFGIFDERITLTSGSILTGGAAVRLFRIIFFATFIFGAAIGSAFAQSASFRSVDKNRDGILTRSELVAAFGRAGTNRLLRSTDHNGDGRITLSELRRGPSNINGANNPRSDSSNDRDDDNDNDGDDGDDGGDGDSDSDSDRDSDSDSDGGDGDD